MKVTLRAINKSDHAFNQEIEKKNLTTQEIPLNCANNETQDSLTTVRDRNIEGRYKYKGASYMTSNLFEAERLKNRVLHQEAAIKLAQTGDRVPSPYINKISALIYSQKNQKFIRTATFWLL